MVGVLLNGVQVKACKKGREGGRWWQGEGMWQACKSQHKGEKVQVGRCVEGMLCAVEEECGEVGAGRCGNKKAVPPVWAKASHQ